MKRYDINKLEKELDEVSNLVSGKEIQEIAHYEQVDQSTVRRYLDGRISIPALAEAILHRAYDIVERRKKEQKA